MAEPPWWKDTSNTARPRWVTRCIEVLSCEALEIGLPPPVEAVSVSPGLSLASAGQSLVLRTPRGGIMARFIPVSDNTKITACDTH